VNLLLPLVLSISFAVNTVVELLYEIDFLIYNLHDISTWQLLLAKIHYIDRQKCFATRDHYHRKNAAIVHNHNKHPMSMGDCKINKHFLQCKLIDFYITYITKHRKEDLKL